MRYDIDMLPSNRFQFMHMFVIMIWCMLPFEFFRLAHCALECIDIICYAYDMWLLNSFGLCLMFDIILVGTSIPINQFDIYIGYLQISNQI